MLRLRRIDGEMKEEPKDLYHDKEGKGGSIAFDPLSLTPGGLHGEA